jgi:hypothetical protein
MPIKVTCPKCQGVLHAPDDAGGKRGKCPTCGTVLSIPAEGPRVSNPGGAPDSGYRAPPAGDEIRQSSFGSRPPEPAEVRKVPPARIPAPPVEPRKLSDPFAKPGSAVVTDATARAWRRTRRGLGTVQLALFLFLLAAIAWPVLALVKHFGVALPNQTPGYLGQQDLSATQEIQIGSIAIPIVLGFLLLTLGRMGAANAPRSSFARGPAIMAGFATLFVVLGLLAAAVPTGGQVASGTMPVVQQRGQIEMILLPESEPSGIAQRAGLGLIALFFPLAEIWFISALGRMGSGLHSGAASGRHTRFLLILGLVFGLIGTYGIATVIDPAGISWARNWFLQQANNGLANLGNNRPLAEYGIPILIALLVWLLYCRLVSGVRRAIREWLDENATV